MSLFTSSNYEIPLLALKHTFSYFSKGVIWGWPKELFGQPNTSVTAGIMSDFAQHHISKYYYNNWQVKRLTKYLCKERVKKGVYSSLKSVSMISYKSGFNREFLPRNECVQNTCIKNSKDY